MLGLALAGCGGDDDEGNGTADEPSGTSDILRRLHAGARRGRLAEEADFPAPAGRSLRALANSVQAGGQVGLASSVFEVGENRLAFGLIDDQNKLIYGKTAVYVAPTPKDQAQGPFLAPADSL